jgi:hypothetical protein
VFARCLVKKCYFWATKAPAEWDLWQQYCRYLQLVARVGKEKDLVDAQGYPIDSRIHAAMMRIPYSEINRKNVWHLASLHHRIYMSSLSSKAIAEHVGGEMRYIERLHVVGRPISVNSLRVTAWPFRPLPRQRDRVTSWPVPPFPDSVTCLFDPCSPPPPTE